VRDGGEELVLGAVGDLRLLARVLLAGQQVLVDLLDPLLLVDVGRGEDPAQDAPALVALRHHAAEMPPPDAILAAQPLLALQGLPAAMAF